MTVLPVAERELRSAARRPGIYWTRLGTVLAGTLIAGWLAYLQQIVPGLPLGWTLFVALSGLSFLTALFAGVGFTADTISAERREGTLGLLFLTDLKPWDVLVGKLAGSSLGALYSLVAVIPVLAIPLLLGGVTGAEYLRILLTVLNTLMWSLSVGILVSTFHTESRTARSQTFGLIFAGFSLGPALGGLLGGWLSMRGVGEDAIKLAVLTFLCVSPGAAYGSGFDQPFRAEPGLFYLSNGVVFLCAVLFFVIAGRRPPGCWQNESAGRPAARLAGLFNPDASIGLGTRQHRSQLLAISPLVWLVCRRWWRRATPWLFLLVTACTYVGMACWVGADWLVPDSYLGLSIFLHLIFKVWISGEAPRQVFDDRKSGAMELLLTMPLTNRDFVLGHVRAMIQLFIRPLLAVAGLDLMLVSVTMIQWDSNEGSGDRLLLWVMREWFLVIDVAALVVLGIWHGASTRKSRVQGYGFFAVILVPWLAMAGMATAVYSPMSGGDPVSFSQKLWLWWLIGTLSVGVFGVLHWKALVGRFRIGAATRPGEKRL